MHLAHSLGETADSCCDDTGHCTNAYSDTYQENLLSGFLQQRNNLIKILVSAGVQNFKVLDTCCTTNCATTANTKTRIAGLKQITAKDGIHYVATGYRNLALRSLSCLKTLLVSPPRTDKPRSFFWRGFKSPKGSNRISVARPPPFRGRGVLRPARGTHLHKGFHPYLRN